MGEEPVVVKAENLKKRYKSVTALDGVNLEIPRSAIFGLLGPNGAGKTTFIRILSGLVFPSSGKVFINGMDLQAHRQECLEKTSFMMDSQAFYPRMSGKDNLTSISILLGEKNKIRVQELLELVGLAPSMKKKFQDYSLGMKKRLDIAACLLNSPEILVLDEPTSGLDPDGAKTITDLLSSLASEGRTILFSSHRLEVVEKIATHLAIINKGKIVVQGPKIDLLAEEGNLESLYFQVTRGKDE